MSALLIIIAVLMFLEIPSGFYLLGKPRKPITPGYLFTVVVVNAFMIIVLVTAALHYGD